MADHDLIGLPEARTAINLTAESTTDHDQEISMVVTGISQRIDEICGPVVARSITEVIDGDGTASLIPGKPPVLAVTSVKERRGGTTTVLTRETFETEPDDGYRLDGWVLHRRRSGRMASWPRDAKIEIVYDAGRFADTAAVGKVWKVAATSILRRLWRREARSWAVSPAAAFGGGAAASSDDRQQFFRAIDPMITEFLSGETWPRFS